MFFSNIPFTIHRRPNGKTPTEGQPFSSGDEEIKGIEDIKSIDDTETDETEESGSGLITVTFKPSPTEKQPIAVPIPSRAKPNYSKPPKYVS